MSEFFNMLRRAFARFVRNPFASPKSQARKLINEMEAEGLRVVKVEELGQTPEAPAPAPEPVAEVAPVVPMTRAERARQLYEQGDYVALYELKKAHKVYWDRLGFKQNDIATIKANKP